MDMIFKSILNTNSISKIETVAAFSIIHFLSSGTRGSPRDAETVVVIPEVGIVAEAVRAACGSRSRRPGSAPEHAA
jgi:hypothetical protein